MTEFNICFSSDDNYAEQVGVAITSILMNSDKDEKFKFYILDGGISSENKKKLDKLTKIKTFEINYLKVDSKDFEECPMLKDSNIEHKDYHVTIPTYYRFKLASLVSDASKVLYLDCDVIVKSSLKELYETDLSSNYVAMILDPGSDDEAERLNITSYFNAGVMLINLDKWKKDNIENQLFEYARKNKDKIKWQDQDILNIILKDKIKVMPRKWNFQYFLNNFSNDEKLKYKYNILHYAGQFKPWTFDIAHPLFEEYYSVLKWTPWVYRLEEYRKNTLEEYFSERYLGTNFHKSLLDDNKKYINEMYALWVDKLNASFNELSFKDQENHKSLLELFNKTDYTNKNVTELFSRSYELDNQLQDLFNNKDVLFKNNDILFKNNDELFKNDSELFKKIDELYNNKAHIYEHIDNVRNDLCNFLDQKMCEKESGLYSEIERCYKYAEDITDKKAIENYHNIQSLKTELLEYREWIGNYFREEFTKQSQYNEVELKKTSQVFQDSLSELIDKKLEEKYQLYKDKSDSDFEQRLEKITTKYIKETEKKLQNQRDIFEIKFESLIKRMDIFPIKVILKIVDKCRVLKNKILELFNRK